MLPMDSNLGSPMPVSRTYMDHASHIKFPVMVGDRYEPAAPLPGEVPIYPSLPSMPTMRDETKGGWQPLQPGAVNSLSTPLNARGGPGGDVPRSPTEAAGGFSPPPVPWSADSTLKSSGRFQPHDGLGTRPSAFHTTSVSGSQIRRPRPMPRLPTPSEDSIADDSKISGIESPASLQAQGETDAVMRSVSKLDHEPSLSHAPSMGTVDSRSTEAPHGAGTRTNASSLRVPRRPLTESSSRTRESQETALLTKTETEPFQNQSTASSAAPQIDVGVDTYDLKPVPERDLAKLSPLNVPKKKRKKKPGPGAKWQINAARRQGPMKVPLPRRVTHTPLGVLTVSATKKVKGRRLPRSKVKFTIGLGTVGLIERQLPEEIRNQPPLTLLQATTRAFLKVREQRIQRQNESYRTWRDQCLANTTYFRFSERYKADAWFHGEKDQLLFEQARMKAIEKERRKKAKREKNKRLRREERLLKDRQEWKEGKSVNLPPAYYRSAYEQLQQSQIPGVPQNSSQVSVKDHARAQSLRRQKILQDRVVIEEERRESATKMRCHIADELVDSQQSLQRHHTAMRDAEQRYRQMLEKNALEQLSASGASEETAVSKKGSTGLPPAEKELSPPQRNSPGSSSTSPKEKRVSLAFNSPTSERERASSRGGESQLPPMPPSRGEVRRGTPSGGAHVNRVGAPGASASGQPATTHFFLTEMAQWEETFVTPNVRPPSGKDPEHRQRWLQQLSKDRMEYNARMAQQQRESSNQVGLSREAWYESNLKRAEEERQEKVRHETRREEAREMNRREVTSSHGVVKSQKKRITEAKEEQTAARRQQAEAQRQMESQLAKEREEAAAQDLERRRNLVAVAHSEEHIT